MRKLASFLICNLFLFTQHTAVAEEAHAMTIAGFTQAYADVVIGLPEAGRVADVSVREGSIVQAGSVLLSLDKEQEELAVARQKFLVEQSEEVDLTQGRVAILKEHFLTTQRLFKNSGAVSQEEYENKKLEYLQAKSELAVLKKNKELEKIDLNLAIEKLNRRVLKAPVNGMVAKIEKKVGESVQAHEELVRLVDISKGYFVGNTEALVGRRLALGQDVCLVFNDGAGRVPAQIVFLSPTIDVASGLMEVKAEFDNSSLLVDLGMAAALTVDNSSCRTS